MTDTLVLNHIGLPLGRRVADVPGVEIVDVARTGTVDPDILERAGERRGSPHAPVLVTFPKPCETLAPLLDTGIEWIHLMSTGVDQFPIDSLGDDQTLTCSRGASAIPISEWVLAHMLVHAKRLSEVWIDEPPEDRWDTDVRVDRLHGRTVVVVGLGAIGSAVATRCLAFGMTVVAVRRTPTQSSVDGVEVCEDLDQAVERADHLVLAAPATEATRHIVDDDLLSKVKPGLHLVNVARGSLVDHDALRRALDNGTVSAASLDTVDPEPLAAGHWLFDHPAVRLTPHMSWRMPGAISILASMLTDNIGRRRAGDALHGIVDRVHGY